VALQSIFKSSALATLERSLKTCKRMIRFSKISRSLGRRNSQRQKKRRPANKLRKDRLYQGALPPILKKSKLKKLNKIRQKN